MEVVSTHVGRHAGMDSLTRCHLHGQENGSRLMFPWSQRHQLRMAAGPQLLQEARG